MVRDQRMRSQIRKPEVSLMGLLEIYLYAGILIPPGYADGFSYSLRSRTICMQKLATIPDSAPSKHLTKCIVKVDPSAAPIS